MRAGLQTAGWDDAKAAESAKLAAEMRRLLYVACTRAEEYLVVSTIGEKSSRAEVLAKATGTDQAPNWQFRGTSWHAKVAAADVDLPAESDWRKLYDRQVAAAGERVAVSAGAIAHRDVPEPAGLLRPGLDKNPRDLELPAWLKGRYGTAVGRAVHATLQTVDLATGDGLTGAAASQALVEGLADQAPIVAALARSAFDSPVLRAAAERAHQKETYVGGVFDGIIVEGFIDLLFTDDSGALVVVDYKTDVDPDHKTLQAYRRQLEVYASLLEQATGRTVSRRVLVFCRENGAAIEREV